jgi:hypothetical protein
VQALEVLDEPHSQMVLGSTDIAVGSAQTVGWPLP